MFSDIQLGLMRLSFGLLFCLMLVYWLQAAFFFKNTSKRLIDFIFFLTLFSLTGLLLLRWIESGHFPLSNLYESLIFLSWSFLVSQLLLQLSGSSVSKASTRAEASVTSTTVGVDSKISQNDQSDLIGVLLSPLALISYTFAFLCLPKEMQQSTSLVPALQSNWLMMHVTVMLLSYAALICGSILSMALLLITFFSRRGKVLDNQSESPWTSKDSACTNSAFITNSAFLEKPLNTSNQAISAFDLSSYSLKNLKKQSELPNINTIAINSQTNTFYSQMCLCNRLDNYSYRMLGLGFPLLTVGILSGAVWANSAWGSYWSWDPKETWALITWLVFAIYLHARITKGWSGQRAAIIATLGFFVVWFCYLGVNLLGAGLHSYGWFT